MYVTIKKYTIYKNSQIEAALNYIETIHSDLTNDIIELRKKLKNAEDINEKFVISSKLEKLPRNSLKVRVRNRCWVTGRGRGYYREFGLSRHVLREMAHDGLLPGVKKASW